MTKARNAWGYGIPRRAREAYIIATEELPDQAGGAHAPRGSVCRKGGVPLDLKPKSVSRTADTRKMPRTGWGVAKVMPNTKSKRRLRFEAERSHCRVCGVTLEFQEPPGPLPIYCGRRCKERWAFEFGPNAAAAPVHATTPAVASGLADHEWSIEELVGLLD